MAKTAANRLVRTPDGSTARAERWRTRVRPLPRGQAAVSAITPDGREFRVVTHKTEIFPLPVAHQVALRISSAVRITEVVAVPEWPNHRPPGVKGLRLETTRTNRNGQRI